MGITEYNEVNDIMEDETLDEVQQIQQDEKWKIRDLNSAVWADGIIYQNELLVAEKEKIADDNIAILQEKIKKLEQWKEDSTKEEKNTIEFFESHLVLWHTDTVAEEEATNRQLVADNKKEKKVSKTIKL